MRRTLHHGVLAAVLLLAIGQPEAEAVPLMEGEVHKLDLDGSLKSLFVGMAFPLHAANTLALYGLSDDYGGMGIADFRLKLEGAHHDRVKWSLHLRTQPLLASFSGATGAMSVGALVRPPRFLPLEVTTPDSATFQWRHEVDRASVSVRLFERLELIAGRQPISFGVGFVWMPADLVGTFSPLEIDREYKPGVDALRLNLALGDFTELALVGALGGAACRNGKLPSGDACSQGDVRVGAAHSLAVARFRTNIGPVDVGLLGGWVRGDVVVGFFATGSVSRFRLRGEAVLTHDLEEDLGYAGSKNPDGDTHTFVRGVLGADYLFDTERTLSLLAEVYYNGFGATESERYFEIARRARVAELGEVFNLGRLYAAAGVNWEPHEKLPISLVLMANLLDPSLQVSFSISYKVGDESDVALGAQIPVGQAPRLGIAAGALEVRSEFGLYPQVYYAMWRAYF